MTISALSSAKDLFVLDEEKGIKPLILNLWDIETQKIVPSSTTRKRAIEINDSRKPRKQDGGSSFHTPEPESNDPKYIEHPYNRFGYKYVLARRTQHLPYLDFKEDNVNGMSLNPIDSNPFVNLMPDYMHITTEKGWCTARAACGVKKGSWYFEVKILNGGGMNKTSPRDGSHVRIGWSRREAYLDWPVGADWFGYGYRDLSGEVFHDGRPKPYGDSFQTGDVIGCLIDLGNFEYGTVKRERIPIKYRGNIFYESREYAQFSVNEVSESRQIKSDYRPAKKRALRTKNTAFISGNHNDFDEEQDFEQHLHNLEQTFSFNEEHIPYMPNSRIEFFKNGKSQGSAFVDLPAPIAMAGLIHQSKRKPKEAFMPIPPVNDDGTLGYYPTLSVFKGGSAEVNFGPDFQFAPDIDCKPFHERFIERELENYLLDLVDEVDLSFTIKPPHQDIIESERVGS